MVEKLFIRGARIIDPSQNMDIMGDLLLNDGKIEAINPSLPPMDAEVLDASGLVAAPGLVDMHVHLRDPGQTQKEDIFSGCRAAAAGGVTSLLAMPNTVPPVDTPELVADILHRSRKADARVYIAAAITQGLKSEEPTDIDGLFGAGAIALSDDGRPVENTRFLADAMVKAQQLGMRVTAHCEDLFLAKGGLINEGSVSSQLGVKGVPAAAEDAGTAREIAVAAAYGVPVHICHVSTAGSVALVRDAKARGVSVTAETCPHYFTLTEEALLSRDADFRMNPPLRTERDRQAILEGLRDGTLDAIATDHAPHTSEEKSDFYRAPNGAIGMETSLAAGITMLVRTGCLSLVDLLRLMSTAPAKILGIPAGTLAVGAPADVILFNQAERWTVDPLKLHGKSCNTPFKGMTLHGRVKTTICGGRIVYQEP